MSLTLRKLKNTSFPSLYKCFIVNGEISKDETCALLSIAIILLNSDNINIQRLGYRIIIIYSNRTNNYAPLYEISINKGLYPITKMIDKKIEDTNKNFFTELNSSFLENYKNKNIYVSEQQKLLQDFYNANNCNTLSVIAPTSYGKSELIIQTLRNHRMENICIITPTKALLAQTKYRVLDEKIDWIKKIVVHPEMYNNNDSYCVAILTQERLFRLLKENPNLFFDTVIIDEAHEILENDRREEVLATTIAVLEKRNKNTSFKFLTPFLANENNLKIRHTSYNLLPFKISEYIKTEKIFLYDIRNNTGLYVYDQYMNDFYNDKNEDAGETSIKFIQKHSSNKNIIYFNKPADIEMFVNDMLINLPEIKTSPKLDLAIKHISSFISPEYTLVKCLKKGVVYHHGSMPDFIRLYIEHLYKEISDIKYIITSSTLLEGVNIPATRMFVMDNRKGKGDLSPSSMKNLIGRICRFDEIFNDKNGTLNNLEPEIYFVFDKYYSKNSNIQSYIKETLKVEKDIADNVENVLLKNTEITKNNEEELRRAEELIENYEPQTIDNYNFRYAKTDLGKSCILNNVNEIDVFKDEDKMTERYYLYLNNYRFSLISNSHDLVDLIYNVFLPFIMRNDENDNILRLNNDPARKFYKMFLDWKINNYSYNQMILLFVSYWRKYETRNEDSLVYVGKWGTYSKGGFRKLWADIRDKDQSQLINLAIVRIKEEQDFIDNTIMKFVEVLNDFKIIEKDFYLTLKYGTSNSEEIVLVKNGLSLNLAQILIRKYSDFVEINTNSNTISLSSSLINEMRKQKENEILVYEVELNVYN